MALDFEPMDSLEVTLDISLARGEEFTRVTRAVAPWKGWVAFGDFVAYTHAARSYDLQTLIPSYHLFLPLVKKAGREFPGTPEVALDRVQDASFADTIVLFTEEKNAGSLEALLATAARVQAIAHASGRPMRIGVSGGQIWVDEEESLFGGEAILEAMSLEDDQDWAGGLVHPSVQKSSAWEEIGDEVTEAEVVREDTTAWLKGGGDPRLALNWPRYLRGDPCNLATRFRQALDPPEEKEQRILAPAVEFYSEDGSTGAPEDSGGELRVDLSAGNFVEVDSPRWMLPGD